MNVNNFNAVFSNAYFYNEHFDFFLFYHMWEAQVNLFPDILLAEKIEFHVGVIKH